MAITDVNIPPDWSSINEQLIWGALSDNVALDNFKYVFEVKNYLGESIILAKVFPDPNSSYGWFDVGNIIRNELVIDWFDNSGNAFESVLVNELHDYNIGCPYSVEIGEDYNIGYSGITELNMASGNTTSYNYVPNAWGKQQSLYNSYNNKFLTNRPLEANVHFANDYTDNEEHIYIGLNSDEVDTMVLYVDVYTNDGSSSLGNELHIGINNTTNYYQLDISPLCINIENGSPLIDENTKYYVVRTFAGEEFRVNMVCKANHEPRLLHFMNAAGVFDTARFDCVSKLNMAVTRKAFEKKGWDVTNIGGTHIQYMDNNQIYRETKVNYSQNMDYSMKLMMNYPTDAEYRWLAELIYSPLIYLQELNNGYNYFYPVTIKNTNYEFIQRISSKLKTLEIEIELNQKRSATRR